MVGGLAAGLILTSCGDDGSGDGTLAPLNSGSIPTGTVPTTVPSVTTSGGSVADPVGDLAVAMSIRLSNQPVEETLELNLAEVSRAQANPASLGAACSLIEEPDAAEVVVSVVDFRRLQSGNRVLSGELRFAADGGAATLTLGDADQQSTVFTGTVTVDEGGESGTYTVTDPSGNSASGSFVCGRGPVQITTTTIEPAPETSEDLGTTSTAAASVPVATTAAAPAAPVTGSPPGATTPATPAATADTTG